MKLIEHPEKIDYFSNKKEFKLLICYEDEVFDGIGYMCNLYFQILPNSVRFIFENQTKNFAYEGLFVFEVEYESEQALVLHFLNAYLEVPGFFIDGPMYVKSDFISEADFNVLLNEIAERDRLFSESMLLLKKITPLIKSLEKKGYSVFIPKKKGQLWDIQCPTKRPHYVKFNLTDKQWYCGYCKVGGAFNDIGQFS
jgi:hypothetical protein